MQHKISEQTNHAPKSSYVEIRLDWYRIIFLVTVVFTIVTRLYGLAYKPYHHDESLYATYSWYLYEGRGYKYDPMMHGPATFYITALAFSLFGDNDFTARLPAALCGVALVCCTPLLKRRLYRTGSIAAAVLFSISPTYMYYSRFLSHDIFVAFWAFLSVTFYVQFQCTRRRGYIYGLGIALAFMFCSKIDSCVYLFIFTTFLIMMKIFEWCFCRTSTNSIRHQTMRKKDKQNSLISAFQLQYSSVYSIYFIRAFSRTNRASLTVSIASL